MISNLMVTINRDNLELSEDLVRHMVLNSLRGHNKKFRKEYGDMVIACDSGNVWRRQAFPNYKAGRKANREVRTQAKPKASAIRPHTSSKGISKGRNCPTTCGKAA